MQAKITVQNTNNNVARRGEAVHCRGLRLTSLPGRFRWLDTTAGLVDNRELGTYEVKIEWLVVMNSVCDLEGWILP